MGSAAQATGRCRMKHKEELMSDKVKSKLTLHGALYLDPREAAALLLWMELMEQAFEAGNEAAKELRRLAALAEVDK